MTVPVTGQYRSGPVTVQSVSGSVIGHFMSGSVTNRDMTVQVTGQCLSCLVTDHFVSGWVTSRGLVPPVISQASGHQLTGPINTSSTSGSVGPSWPSAGLVVPSRTILSDHSVRLDLDTTFSALHHTMDWGRVSSPPPPRHKAGRRSRAVSPWNGTMAAAMRFRPTQGLALVIPRLPIRVRIITDGVIGIVLFLGVDLIASHAIDRNDDTIAEIEGVNYLPGLQGDRNLLGNLRGSIMREMWQIILFTHVPCTTSGFPSRLSLAISDTLQNVQGVSPNCTIDTYPSGSSVHLTGTLQAPGVSATVPCRISPAATPANPETIWIQQTSGHFEPSNLGLPPQASDLPSTRPLSPALSLQVPADDPLVLEGQYVPWSGTKPSGSSALNLGLMEYTDRVDPSHSGDPDQSPGQDSSAVPSEAGSEVQEPEPHYLASINQVYEVIFNTLDDDFCKRPAQSIIGSAVTVTKKVARRPQPDRVGRATGREDLCIPIGSTIKSAFDTVEAAKKPFNQPWKAPKDLAEPKPVEGGGGESNKPPVADPATGLDLSKLPPPDADMSKLNITIPVSSILAQVPFSMLENWELWKRGSTGLTNQLDLMAATALDMVWDLSDLFPRSSGPNLFFFLERLSPFPLMLLRPWQKCFAFEETLFVLRFSRGSCLNPGWTPSRLPRLQLIPCLGKGFKLLLRQTGRTIYMLL